MSEKKRIIVTVITDLVTDQRVNKVCTSLSDNGYEVFLIGALWKNSLPLVKRNYKAIRLPMFFHKKVWFYAEFNIRLFFKLLFTKGDIFLGNDLDVMPATFLAARLKRKPVVYDTHEYFLGMPQLNNKPLVKKVWTLTERFIFPRLNHIYTICQSFCDLYYKDYGKKLSYIRNVPMLNVADTGQFEHLKKEIEAKLPLNKNLLLLQGTGINIERGGEELVLSMQYLDPEKFHLLIIGGGEVFEILIKMVSDLHLEDRITILPKVPPEVLRYITRKAALGFTLDKPNNINHLYGLPNKIFDYLHAGIPVLSSRLVELEHIIADYEVGAFIENHDPNHIAARIKEIFEQPDTMAKWKANTQKVKKDFNWELEEKKLISIFQAVSSNS